MKSLSVEDMGRIFNSGDLFVLFDVRPVDITKGSTIPRAVRVPFGREIVRAAVAASGERDLPIVVCGDGPNDSVAEQAAEELRKAGFGEVWCYSSDPAAWICRERQSAGQTTYVVSDPDACVRG